MVGLAFCVLGCASPSAPAAQPSTPTPFSSPIPSATQTRTVSPVSTPSPASPISTPTSTAIPLSQLAVRGGDCYLEAPDQIEAGLIRITFQNIGARNHNLKIWRMKPGKTVADVKGVEDLNATCLTAETFFGGLNSISPVTTKTAILDLAQRRLHPRERSAAFELQRPRYCERYGKGAQSPSQD